METTTTWCLGTAAFQENRFGLLALLRNKKLDSKSKAAQRADHVGDLPPEDFPPTEGEAGNFKSFEQWKSTGLAEQLRIRAATSSHSR